jgi:tetratricopeptide (TPR) repeat protein
MDSDTGLNKEPSDPVPPRRRFLPEAACVLLVAVMTGLLVFQTALAPFGDQLEGRFRVVLYAFRAPAMLALGHGMRDFDMGSVPALHEFYRGFTPSVDAAGVPKDLHTEPVRDSYQLMHYHLLYAIGWAWRLLGISTWTVHALCAVFYAALMAVLYGLFRLAMGRALSVLVVLFLSTSPAYLHSCPSLRDFSKAPFMLGFFLLAAVLLTRRQTGRSLLAWSVAAGVLAGVGYGFRQDLLTCMPAALALILFLSRVSGERAFRWRVLSAFCALAAFGAAGWAPISGTLTDHGSASAQALVQGASEMAEARMDFGRASYTMHYEYPDIFDFTVVNSFARRRGNHEPMQGHFSAEHGRMGKQWFREEVREYPADIFSRGIASALMLPKISALSLEELVRFPSANQASIARFSPLHRALAGHFAAWGLWYVLAGLALFAFYDLRAASGAGLLLIYFAALPGLLFEFRHFFHLAFVPYWVAAAMTAWAGRVLWRVVRKKRPFLGETAGRTMPRRIAGAVLLPLALVSGLALTLAGLWQVQALTVSRVLSQYEQAKLEPVPVREEAGERGILLRPDAALPGLAPTDTLAAFESCGEYLVLDMDYDGLPIRLRAIYDCADSVNFTHWMQPHINYPGHPCRVRLFFPVYQTVWPQAGGADRGRFAGVEVEHARRGLIHGLYRVANAGDFALWPYMTVPEERGTFAGYKSGPHDRAPAVLAERLHSLFSTDPQARVAAEIAMAKCRQGYVPRLTDAASTEDEVYGRWKLAVQSVPELAPQAVADLKRFLPGPAAPDSAAELRVQLRIAEFMPGDTYAATRAARLQIDLGDPANAAARARAVLLGAPEHAFAARTLNEALAAMGQPERRLAAWRELHGTLPASVLFSAHLALALWEGGAAEEGLRVLDSVTPGDGTNPEALVDFGGALAAYGRIEQGIAQIDRALGAAPHLSGQAANSCAEAGEARSRAGDNASALVLFEKARAIGPVNLAFTVRLGELREAEGDARGALEEFRAIVSNAPDSPQSARRMDAIYERLNDVAGRLETWRKISAAHPGTGLVQMHLGLACEAAGDTAGAEVAYRQALSLDKSLSAGSPLFDRIKNTDARKP